MPDTLAVKLGKTISGSVSDLDRADGAGLVIQKFIVPNSNGPSIQFEVQGISPFLAPQSISMTCKAKIDTSGSFKHTIELWNYQIGSWDPVDRIEDTLTTSYKTFNFVAAGDLSRFVDPTTHRTRARLTLTRTGVVSKFVWTTTHDHFNWIVRN
ncbi:MAG: hypothetical protein JST30_01755 [Armatimonadetes bacterium]|nr:hypothetical protein [Armatimonadota bacterium]